MKLAKSLMRRKLIDLETITHTKLSRCLNTLDLTLLGIGSTLGAGIYIVAGHVAVKSAGPAVVLSFLIAAIASILAGVCYAEFGARVPRTGSAYVYCYVTIGELPAFIIGWNLILEYVIGTASVARAWSGYLDSVLPGTNPIASFFTKYMPMDIPSLSAYPDFLSFAVTFILMVILAMGVRGFARFNNLFTCVNLLVVIYVILVGAFKINFHNWSIPPSEIPSNTPYPTGNGGFFPFGFSGLMAGAATCFYAFVGFDAIATTVEECRNPQRAVPISIVVSLFCCFLAYFGVSGVITLMVPYYDIHYEAPLPDAFSYVGYPVAKYVVAVGAICGLSSSLLGALFPLPRVIYAMAEDGVIFRFLAYISPRFKTPIPATILAGIFSGLMAMFFDLDALIEMMSIGTLLAYTIVAVSVLIIRYRPLCDLPGAIPVPTGLGSEDDTMGGSLDGDMITPYVYSERRNIFKMLFSPDGSLDATFSSSFVATTCIVLSQLFSITEAAIIIFLEAKISDGVIWSIALLSFNSVCLFLCWIIVSRQPENTAKISFKVPFVPWVPLISSFINIFLILKLSVLTWIRFAVWMTLGFLVYFLYGMTHSSEYLRAKRQVLLKDISSPDFSGREDSCEADDSSEHAKLLPS